jgi:hypothetical protein
MPACGQQPWSLLDLTWRCPDATRLPRLLWRCCSPQVALELAAFGLALLADKLTGRLDVNRQLRAEQLRAAIERLGPAYVKVAQVRPAAGRFSVWALEGTRGQDMQGSVGLLGRG